MAVDVTFYAIRIKGTDLFKGVQNNFVPFEQAMHDGVYSNTFKTAEKKLKEYNSEYKGGTKAHPKGRYFCIFNESENKWENFTCDYNSLENTRINVNYMDIELEIVELKMSIA